MNSNLIAGRYRLDRALGSGGMGDVRLAHDTQLDRPVAIKFLALDRLREWRSNRDNATVQLTDRFLREARAMARVNSPHVVTVYEQGQEDHWHYLVMEMIDGAPLSKYMGGGMDLTLAQTVRWGAQICDGLTDAHHAEVVHRDIKPDNIMITDRNEVKLVDFGLALLLDATVTHGGGLTLLYAAPERINGQPGDERSDLYSFGCVLYEMLTGRPPFGNRDSSPGAIAELHLRHMPPAPQNVRSGIPGELNDLALELLAKEPRRRPHDAATVAHLIRQVTYAVEPSDHGPAAAEPPHVDPDYVEQIQKLELSIRRMQLAKGHTDPAVLDARMRLAELTGESGDRRGAASLYKHLGNDCRSALGPFDRRTLDAFEAVTRWITAD
ncbi:serine/threonine-protein kinase [Kitasatospora sp. NPDC051984]|uniref:serine/threonine-protein kinase n=1 Tax=Kitasatospora sp. NPDC051984 TaxID=3364059 RepID=UPI0037C67262